MELETHVEAPPEQVWAVMTDLDGAADRLSAIEAVDRVAGPEFGPGTRWRETRRAMGQSRVEEMEIVEVDAPHAYVIASEGGGAQYRTTLRVEAAGGGDGSRLSMVFETRPTSRVGSVVATLTGPLVRRLTRGALEQDLSDLKVAAESAGSR